MEAVDTVEQMLISKEVERKDGQPMYFFFQRSLVEDSPTHFLQLFHFSAYISISVFIIFFFFQELQHFYVLKT